MDVSWVLGLIHRLPRGAGGIEGSCHSAAWDSAVCSPQLPPWCWLRTPGQGGTGGREEELQEEEKKECWFPGQRAQKRHLYKAQPPHPNVPTQPLGPLPGGHRAVITDLSAQGLMFWGQGGLGPRFKSCLVSS